ncbi:MAG: DUF4234 domain-containing protein [Nitrososphaerota archaeon]
MTGLQSSRIPYILEQVRHEVRRRGETDRRISYAWIALPIISTAIGLAIITMVLSSTTHPVLFLLTVGSFYLVALIASIIYAILLYRLIARRNRHFSRQLRLLEYTVQLLREAARLRGADAEARLISVERELREARDEEGERSAVLWTILTVFTGIAGLYVYYFLMRDFRRHEQREDRVLEDLSAVISSIGGMPLPGRGESVPKRSFALYLALSLVTLGIFGIYWTYALIRDPNVHFREQARLEDELLRRLEQLAS